MSWLVKLYNTYNFHEKSVGVKSDSSEKSRERFLMPMHHSTQTAHIEVTVDAEGNFIKAEVIPKSDSETVIPVTEKSENRTAAGYPHGLSDNLGYISSIESKSAPQNYEKYKSQLKSWLDFEENPMIKAVYLYISKDSIIKDLIGYKILPSDENGKLLDDKKLADKFEIYKVLVGELKRVFVRFSVVGMGATESATYKNIDVWNSWSRYQNHLLSNQTKALCYVTGKNEVAREYHPKKIRYSADQAKLISSNDSSNFTYRGKFTEPAQVVHIGYSVSSKAHAALTWLISKQAYKEGGHTVLAWSDKTLTAPNPFGPFDETNYLADTNEQYSKQLRSLLSGYQVKIDKTENVNIIALDSATTGRMSVIYYREFNTEDYVNRLMQWYNTCKWEKRYFLKGDKVLRTCIAAPSPKDIYFACYGYVIDDKLYHQLIGRLLPCISEAKPLPFNLVIAAIRKVSNRQSFEESYQWEDCLNTVCALIKKYYKKEDSAMALNEQNNHRDYLYGRLLAVAELLEKAALKENDDKRATNAERYFTQMSARPFKTWKIIEEALQPYIARLGPKAIFYSKIIDDIMFAFKEEDFLADRPLSGEYLLGYHNQRKALYAKKDKDTEEQQK